MLETTLVPTTPVPFEIKRTTVNKASTSHYRTKMNKIYNHLYPSIDRSSRKARFSVNATIQGVRHC